MKILCKHLFVLAVIICCIAGVTVSAQAEEIIASGTCGKNVTWTLDDEHVLIISGTGAMAGYPGSWDTPWFDYRDSIISVMISDGVTSIGNCAFSGCSNLQSITIPDSVISIDGEAFHHCSSLQSITIPESVTSISGMAFIGCTSLTSINIPERVTSIGMNAFQNCSSLQSITIPESITEISQDAFNGCSSLQSITIPESVTNIGKRAFQGCSSLKRIYVSQNNIHYSSDDCGVLFNKNQTILIQAPGAIKDHYIIPESVTSIGEYAFQGCSSLTGITIPTSVTNIGSDAFGNCTNLTGITIPDSVTNIGSNAFWNCTNLTSVTIGNSVTNIGRYAFQDCSSIQSITIPDSVTNIGHYAFLNCSRLQRVTIPDSIAIIDYGVFKNCTSLASITIPDSITSIGDYAFSNCSSLQSITIPESVNIIGKYAFSNCNSLRCITLSDCAIYDYAFSNCSNLNHVAYTGTQSQWDSLSEFFEITFVDNAVLHYETRFQDISDCVGTGVYCPVCEKYLVSEQYKGAEHSYGDWVVITPATFDAEGEKEKICSLCSDRLTETIPMLTCRVSHWGISLKDDIGATFHLNLENWDLENTFVTVQVEDTQYKYDIFDLATADGKYVVKVNVAAAQMCDDIIIQVCRGDTASQEMRYTIRQYAEYILNGNYSKETKYLVQTMLNYGAAAQKLFKHNTANLANSGYEITNAPEIPKADTSSSVTGAVDDIAYYGASLNCEAKIRVEFYFTITGKIGDYTFTDKNGNTYRTNYNGGMYSIAVPIINPADYDEIIEITVSDGTDNMQVKYTPLRYISRTFYGSNDTNLVNMVTALYRYHKAAESYLDSL